MCQRKRIAIPASQACDLDDCLDLEGNLKLWARGVVERFSDSYIEISPSGHGLKIWLRGELATNLPGV